jgi:hypothetical protein
MLAAELLPYCMVPTISMALTVALEHPMIL